MSRNDEEIVSKEWQDVLDWYGVTHQEKYLETVQKKANERLDFLMLGMVNPSVLKNEEGYKDLDTTADIRERAAGEIQGWSTVLSWRPRAEAGYETLKQGQHEETFKEENQEEELVLDGDQVWADMRD